MILGFHEAISMKFLLQSINSKAIITIGLLHLNESKSKKKIRQYEERYISIIFFINKYHYFSLYLHISRPIATVSMLLFLSGFYYSNVSQK